MQKICFFDLDGTLVDSLPGIARSLSFATGITNTPDFTNRVRKLIGPPVLEMLRELLSDSADVEIEPVLRRFRSHYDLCGVNDSPLFPGVLEALNAISGGRHRLFVVTNKPQDAALKVLKNNNILEAFERVVAGDVSVHSDTAGRVSSKRDRAMALAAQIGTSVDFFVGDSPDDLDAADAVQCRFVAACWGYGVDRLSNSRDDMERVFSARELPAVLS